MKKLIALILTLTLMMPAAAWACLETEMPLLVSASMNTTFEDASWWALTEDNILAGIKDEGENLPHLPVQQINSQYVAGHFDNGWMRMAAYVRIVEADCRVVGLTKLNNVTITIQPQYIDLSLNVIHELLGDVELSANAISACMQWRDGNYITTIFAPSYSDRFTVGSVTFNNGEDTTPLCLVTFCGQLHFALMCGYWIPEPEPVITQEQYAAEQQARAEAEARATTAEAKAYAEAQARANAEARADYAIAQAAALHTSGDGDGCNRNNNVVQVNLSVFGSIKNWLGIGNKTERGCDE